MNKNNQQFLHDVLGINVFIDNTKTFCAEMEVTEKVCRTFWVFKWWTRVLLLKL